MLPLSQGERSRRETPEDFVTWLLDRPSDRILFPKLDPKAVVQGGYPDAVSRQPHRARIWFQSYISRLSDHDARELQDGGYARQLASLLTYLAALGQTELVKAHVARALSVAESTVDGYLRLAQTMRLVCEFPSWNRALHKRVIKRPKICLTDTGLSASLAGFTAEKALTPGGREYYGALVEQFVALELMKQRSWSATDYAIHHFRDADGLEIDLVIETWDGRLIAIEVKTTTTPQAKHWAGLSAFKERFFDRDITGVLFHAGDTSATLHDWLHIMPITALWNMPA
jgi:predicted AAA+ superfamily ATPase